MLLKNNFWKGLGMIIETIFQSSFLYIRYDDLIGWSVARTAENRVLWYCNTNLIKQYRLDTIYRGAGILPNF